MKFVRNLSARILGSEKAGPESPVDTRAYVVGDIHGRLDLLNITLDRILDDCASGRPARVFVVFLGDYIDRGPDSCGVIERLKNWRPPAVSCVFLAGNHEEALLHVLQGNHALLADWLGFGGAECALSYGLKVDDLRSTPPREAAARLRGAIPIDHIEFLETLGDTFRFGDYLFVHAGILPGVPIEDQSTKDLRWIRDPFLDFKGDHGVVVVHGHTIVDETVQKANRIAIDTGAYKSGRLTTLVLEGKAQFWFTT